MRQHEEPVQPQGRVLCVHLQVCRAEVENRTFKMLVKFDLSLFRLSTM